MPKPLVSVIVPIYNTEAYLETCLKSLMHQTYRNLEIILVDDGSTDSSRQIAATFAKKDSRIKIIHQRNRGQSAARNAGLQKANGEFISFVDSDDEVTPNFIAKLLAPHQAKSITLSVCGIRYNNCVAHTTKVAHIHRPPVSRSKRLGKPSVLFLLAAGGWLYACHDKLYRADFIKHCRFDESINFAEDTKFVLDYLSAASGGIAFVGEPLYIYNFGTASGTVKQAAAIWGNWQKSYRSLRTWLGANPTLLEKFWLHVVHLRWRISYLRSRRRAKAIDPTS